MGNGIIRKEVEFDLTPRDLAEAFCNMADEEQAQFFIECADIMATWKDTIARAMQMMEVSKHLRECSCSTDRARDMIRELASGLGDAY